MKAGSTVGFVLDQAIFHHGPINVYMAKAPSTAASFNGAGTVWFKIAQQGAITDGGSYVSAKSAYSVGLNSNGHTERLPGLKTT